MNGRGQVCEQREGWTVKLTVTVRDGSLGEVDPRRVADVERPCRVAAAQAVGAGVGRRFGPPADAGVG